MEADCIIISDVFNKNAIEDGFRLAPEKIVEELQRRGKKAEFIASPEGIVKFLKDNTDNGDVVLVMSNGSFGGLIEMLKQTLSGNST
jgi:UDP-N-acetylmuramate: L-alanyl-gamma-D-glutamyl-meso-diaminopimelate ligase